MGESDRFLERRIAKISLGDDTNALMALIAINGMIFICFGMVQVIYQMSGSNTMVFQYEVLRWAILPAKLSTLAYEPWAIFTFMFVHTGVIMTIVNLLWLWAFGSILQNVAGNRVIFPLYIYGGFAGAIFFIASSYAIPQLHDQIEYLSIGGASASILAIAAAVTTMVPKYRIFPMLNGGIPLWVITFVYAIICLASNANHIADIFALAGGGLLGYLFMYHYQRGRDWGAWMNNLYSWFANLFDPARKRVETVSPRNTFFYKTGSRSPYERQPTVTQEKIDYILDKINKEGMDHLTDEERTILNKASEEDF